LIPHLLIDGIPLAIRASKATKVYYANLMTQPGETSGMTVSDHLAALLRHAGRFGPGLIDVCVVNSSRLASSALTAYRRRSAQPVKVDTEAIERMGIEVVSADLVGRVSAKRLAAAPGLKIRHDPAASGAIALDLARQSRLRRRRRAS